MAAEDVLDRIGTTLRRAEDLRWSDPEFLEWERGQLGGRFVEAHGIATGIYNPGPEFVGGSISAVRPMFEVIDDAATTRPMVVRYSDDPSLFWDGDRERFYRLDPDGEQQFVKAERDVCAFTLPAFGFERHVETQVHGTICAADTAVGEGPITITRIYEGGILRSWEGECEVPVLLEPATIDDIDALALADGRTYPILCTLHEVTQDEPDIVTPPDRYTRLSRTLRIEFVGQGPWPPDPLDSEITVAATQTAEAFRPVALRIHAAIHRLREQFAGAFGHEPTDPSTVTITNDSRDVLLDWRRHSQPWHAFTAGPQHQPRQTHRGGPNPRGLSVRRVPRRVGRRP
ncbi:hypothetical protein CDO52_00820 [Nocardiopsis gilva YIM 90087]|uniref:Uncharacterized protein n=1 Tax=Nocardiopsis gilva YIM 90087 TaxID=1235441 RepID=A0A223S070_9ACTN|nr:hypothetical protein [Nocardiopsis gilva]ASU81521.1 hypothetical protein CDO52_00820 [Nocardiopsis gilva YIM 90087]